MKNEKKERERRRKKEGNCVSDGLRLHQSGVIGHIKGDKYVKEPTDKQTDGPSNLSSSKRTFETRCAVLSNNKKERGHNYIQEEVSGQLQAH